MAEKEKRVTRSSSSKAGGKSAKTDKILAFSESETAALPEKKSVKKSKASLKLENEATNQAPHSESNSLNSADDSHGNQTSKKVNTKRKQKSSENETEKENLKLSNCSSDFLSEKSKPADEKCRMNPAFSNEHDYCDIFKSTIKKKKQGACNGRKVSSKSGKKPDVSSTTTSKVLSHTEPFLPSNYNKTKTNQSSLERTLIFSSQLGAVIPFKSKNICQQYFESTIGRSSYLNSQVVARSVANQLINFEVADNHHPFQCRITSIEWHPRKENFLGVGSKHGDKIFYKIKRKDYSRLEVVETFQGIGPGGNISSMKFHPSKDELVYTSSLCGKVMLSDIEGRLNQVLLDTMSWDFWYSALDVHKTDFLVCAGRNKGQAVLLDKEGKSIWEKRLHMQKISHLEFSPEDPNVFCTASMDHSVRIWDLRNVQEKKPVEVLTHNFGLNSACFSLMGGSRLLTTDQKAELRVYRSPLWHEEQVICHPHRFFQHITPIKASWHPHADIVMCGRYPDGLNLPHYGNVRSIDLFDAGSGKLIGEMNDPNYDGIISLIKMNSNGTKLVSSMGYNLNLWNMEASQRETGDSREFFNLKPDHEKKRRRDDTGSGKGWKKYSKDMGKKMKKEKCERKFPGKDPDKK